MTQGPTPSTKPLRGPHDIGEIVGYSYRIYGTHFAALFGLALLTVPLQLLSGVVAQSSDSDGVQAIVNLIQIPGAFVSLVVAAAITFEIHNITGGERAAFNRGLDNAFDRFGALLSTALLLFVLMVAAGLAGPFLAVYWLFNKNATIDGRRDWYLAVIPFLLLFYVAIRWSFNTQSVMIGGRRNWGALDDSAAAVRGSWWRVLGIMLVVGLIVLGPTLLAQFAVLLPPLPSAAIIGVVSALVLPFAVIAQTLLYYDLKSRTANHRGHTQPPPEAVEPIAEAEETQG